MTSQKDELSDADVLERAADVMERHDLAGLLWRNDLTRWAAKLRAASAPKPVDVFEAFESEADLAMIEVGEVARSWFGPLDQLLSEIEAAPGAWQTRAAATRAALRRRASDASQPPEGAIRQRAQEASRG